MSSPTIADLRKRAYILANNSINDLNFLNSVIYPYNTPTPIPNIEEDTTNISLDYIQKGINIANQYTPELTDKYNFMIQIFNKHNECLNASSYL